MPTDEEEPEELNLPQSRETLDGHSTAPRSPELNKLEAALAELAPRAIALDRDRLMYLAGQASVDASGSGIRENSEREPPWRSDFSRSRLPARGSRWPVAFSGMSALAATLLVLLVSRPPRVVERVVRVTVPAAVVADERPQALPSDSPAPRVAAPEKYFASDSPRVAVDGDRRQSPSAYRDLRDRVLAMGIETWTSQPSEGGKSSPPETYREMLNDALQGG